MAKSVYDEMIGKKFGRWTVIKRLPNTAARDAKFWCRCECGTERAVLGKNLKNGRSTSCGCYKKEVDTKRIIEMNKAGALDLRGQRFGKLVCLEPTEERTKYGAVIWKCQCDCGNICYLSTNALKGQHPTLSCGCKADSRGETAIRELLNNNNIKYETQYWEKSWDKDKHYKYDFYLPKENRLIEYDGKQHYEQIPIWEDLSVIQERDKEKNNIARANSIPLIRIPYWERDKITLDMIMGEQYLVK